MPASFGALWQIGLVLIAILIWRIFETLVSAAISFAAGTDGEQIGLIIFCGFFIHFHSTNASWGHGNFAAFTWSIAANWFSQRHFQRL